MHTPRKILLCAAIVATIVLPLTVPQKAESKGWGWAWSPAIKRVAKLIQAALGPGLKPSETENMLTTYGQSNSIGTNSGGADTTSVIYTGEVIRHTGLVDLVESGVETPASSMTNWLRKEQGAGFTFYNEALGVSGKDWEQLRKGGSEPTNWTNMFAKITSTHGSVAAAECLGMAFIHGESDSWDRCNGSTCTGVYEGYLDQLQIDFETDCIAETGQSRQPGIFLTQMASWHQPSTCYGPEVPLEQVSAARTNSLLYLVSPLYHLGLGVNTIYSADGVHFGDNGFNGTRGHDLVGQYIGRALAETYAHNRPWKPLWVSSTACSGSTVRLTYEVPCTRAGNCSGDPLVIDTTAVIESLKSSSVSNYGFKIVDPNPRPRHLTNVAIEGTSNVVVLTLNDTCQENTQVDIGLDYQCAALPGNGSKPQNIDSSRINLRDTSSDTSQDMTPAETLVNWAVQERVTATGGSAPVSTVSTVIDDYEWTWAYVAESGTSGEFPDTGCATLEAWRNLRGGYDIPWVSGNCTAAQGTGSADAADIGSGRVNQAVDIDGGGWESSGTPTVFAKGSEDDMLIRFIGETNRPSALSYPLWYGTTDANNRFYLQFDVAGNVRMIFGSDAGDLTSATGVLLPASPTFGIIDWYVNNRGVNGNVSITICVNGTCETDFGGLAGGAVGCKSGGLACGLTEPLALDMALAGAFNQTSSIVDNPFLFFGAIVGEGARNWSEAKHLADWNAIQ